MNKILTTTLVAAFLPLSGLAASYDFATKTTKLQDMPHGTAVTWGLNNASTATAATNPTLSAVINTSGSNYTNLLNEINNSGKIVTSATITLWDIWDWTGETKDPADALFVNILGGLNSGVSSKAFAPVNDGDSNSWTLAINPFIDSPTTSNDFNDRLQNSTTSYPGILNFNEADAANAGSLLRANRDLTTKAGIPDYVTWSDPAGGSGTPDFNLVITLTGANLAFLTTLLDNDTNNGSNPNVGFGFAAECHYYMDGVTFSLTTGDAPPPPSVPDSGSTLALLGLGMAAVTAFRRSRN